MLHIWSLVLKTRNKRITFNLISNQGRFLIRHSYGHCSHECFWPTWFHNPQIAHVMRLAGLIELGLTAEHTWKKEMDGWRRESRGGKEQGMNRITHWDPAVHSGRCRERGWGGGSWEVMGRRMGGFTEWRKGAGEGWGATGWVVCWEKWRTQSGSVSANPVDGYRRVGPLVGMVVVHNPWNSSLSRHERTRLLWCIMREILRTTHLLVLLILK